MIRHEQRLGTTGRYSGLTRPIGAAQTEHYEFRHPGESMLNAHNQMLFFVVFALLVGAGLLMIVPRLSAATGGAEVPAGDDTAPTASAVSELESGDGSTGAESSEPDPAAAQPEAGSAGVISPIFTKEVQHWAPKIREWSQLYNLDPDIIATIMQIESCGDPSAASYAGAQGLFQVMPFHFDPGEDMLDPDNNARRGMAFYNRQLEYTGWDIYLSFAGYNGGYAASGSSYPYWANETQRYFTWAKGIYDDAKAGLVESPNLQNWLQAGGGGGCQRAAQRLGI